MMMGNPRHDRRCHFYFYFYFCQWFFLINIISLLFLGSDHPRNSVHAFQSSASSSASICANNNERNVLLLLLLRRQQELTCINRNYNQNQNSGKFPLHASASSSSSPSRPNPSSDTDIQSTNSANNNQDADATNNNSVQPLQEPAAVSSSSMPTNSNQNSNQNSNSNSNSNSNLPTITQVDVIYGSKTSLVYDKDTGRFLPKTAIRQDLPILQLKQKYLQIFNPFVRPILNSPPGKACHAVVKYNIQPYLHAAFVPDGVTPAYYQYTRWRFLQRWINANLQVLGTQSLLVALGIKTHSLAAVSAALNWVLKDALGKMVRMIWASKMGGRFDSDAKRWRFRAALLYATGNGLEILTGVLPPLFLLLAASANCCKQMSMLTCSSTRTALYNSFRDGTRENIGDITAKGEASIAVVDLMGIATGVLLGRNYWGTTTTTTSVAKIWLAYLTLQTMEIACIYRMMRTVQFRVLNFERLVQVLQDFISIMESDNNNNNNNNNNNIDDSLEVNGNINATDININATYAINNEDNNQQVPISNNTVATTTTTPAFPSSQQRIITRVTTPEEIARTEKIIQPPAHLSRRALAFGSLSRAQLSPPELAQLLQIFAGEKFLLVVGKNRKTTSWRWWPFQQTKKKQKKIKKSTLVRQLQENCHIVLHTEATNADIVKSTLALLLLRQKLSLLANESGSSDANMIDPESLRSKDCFELIQSSLEQANQWLPRLLRQLANQGWMSPARFMFGRVTMRAEWPLVSKQQSQTPTPTQQPR